MSKILVADDENDIVELITMALENHGHIVHPFYAGDEIIAELKKSDYDLVIMDILMPGIDGFNIQLKLNEDKKLKNTPVIIISALQPASSLFEKFEQVKGFIVKPFDPEELVKKVEEVLKSSK